MSKVLGTSHKKIAIVGSAPSSINLAPYADSDWEIWGTSPGVFGVAPRTNIWFEMHRFHSAEPGRSGAAGTVPHFSPEYTAFLRTYQDRVNVGDAKVFMSATHDDIPSSVRYPFDDIQAKYGLYHWSSTIAWMLALAIEQEPDEIGLWGVDMAAQEEYLKQRGDCQHFIRLAKEKGIKITLPVESDLMQPMFRYGLDELSPMGIKIKSRLAEFNGRLANNRQQQSNLKNEEHFLMGAADDAKYMPTFWTNSGDD
jgi:hypothetical protein